MNRYARNCAVMLVALGMLAISTAPVLSWTPPANLSIDADETRLPDIAVGNDGTFHAVWTNATTREMKYSWRPYQGSWSAPAVVGTYAGTTWFMDGDITIAVVPDGTVHILYTDDSSGDSEIYHRSKPPGGAWSTPENISNTPGARSDMPDVAVSPDGIIHAAWIDATPSTGWCCGETYYASKSPGGAWTAAINISNSSANEYPTRIGVGPDNSVHVVTGQEDGGPGRQNLYYYTKPAGGSFGAGVNLTVTIVSGRAPAGVLKTADGFVHVLSYECGTSNISTCEVIYRGKPPCSSQWYPAFNLSNDANGSWDPALAADGCGNLHVAWIDDGGGAQKIVYSGRTTSSGWTAPVDITGGGVGANTPRFAVAGPRESTNATVVAVFVNSPSGNPDVFCTEVALTDCELPVPVDVQDADPGREAATIGTGIRVAPNPTNGRVRLAVRTPGAAASITIYDVSGRLLRVLQVPGLPQSWVDVEWDGRDENGRDAAAGVYWVKLGPEESSTVERVVLVR